MNRPPAILIILTVLICIASASSVFLSAKKFYEIHDRVADALAPPELCLFVSDSVSKNNRICSYDCPSGKYAMTVKSSALCPASITR